MDLFRYLANVFRHKIVWLILFVVSVAFAGNFDNLGFNTNTISSRNTNGHILLDPNGTGQVRYTDATASRVAVFDSNKGLVSSSVSDTTLTYLDVASSLTSLLAGKQATGDYITSLTSDVTASGPGAAAATIANDAVTNAKAANMVESTLKGRAAGAGTGDPTDLTATQATAILNNMVGDSGSGGTKGLVPAPASGDAAASKFLKADGTWAAPSGSGGSSSRNFLYNAEWRFFQRQIPGTLTSFQDDAYGPDRWYVLTSGGAVNVQTARVAEVIATSPTQYVVQVRQADGTARRIGIAQIIPANESLALRGREATFAFYHRTDGTEITAIRAGIVEWTGTADSVTSDIVSSWADTPTLIANSAFINTPATITASSSWAQASVTATFGSSMNNAIVFIWTEGTEAQNDDFYLAQMQLVRGAAAIEWPYIAIPYTQDLLRNQRHFVKSYNVDVPAGAASEGQTLFIASRAYTQNGANAIVSEKLAVDMFATPTITLYSPSTGTAGKARDETTSVDLDADAGWVGTSGFGVDFTIVDQRIYRYQWKAEAEL